MPRSISALVLRRNRAAARCIVELLDELLLDDDPRIPVTEQNSLYVSLERTWAFKSTHTTRVCALALKNRILRELGKITSAQANDTTWCENHQDEVKLSNTSLRNLFCKDRLFDHILLGNWQRIVAHFGILWGSPLEVTQRLYQIIKGKPMSMEGGTERLSAAEALAEAAAAGPTVSHSLGQDARPSQGRAWVGAEFGGADEAAAARSVYFPIARR